MLFKKIKGIRVNEDEDFRIYSIDFDRTFDRTFKWIYPELDPTGIYIVQIQRFSCLLVTPVDRIHLFEAVNEI